MMLKDVNKIDLVSKPPMTCTLVLSLHRIGVIVKEIVSWAKPQTVDKEEPAAILVEQISQIARLEHGHMISIKCRVGKVK